MVSPPSDASKVAATPVQANRSPGSGTLPDPRQGTAPAAPAAIDRSEIRPLDLVGALQILIAEVRAAFELALLEVQTSPPAADAPPPAARYAARDIVEWVLQSLPENSQDVSLWSETLPRVEAALESGMESALRIIEAWHGVPPPVAAGAREIAVLVSRALVDDPLNPLWIRAEWAGLAPRLLRLRRRRRVLHRRMTDPDYRPSYFDDLEP